MLGTPFAPFFFFPLKVRDIATNPLNWRVHTVIIHEAAAAEPIPAPPGYIAILAEAPTQPNAGGEGKGKKKDAKVKPLLAPPPSFVGVVVPGDSAPAHANGCAGVWQQWVATATDGDRR